MGDLKVAKGKVIMEMQAFKNSCVNFIELYSTRSISFTDMRMELTRVEAWRETLRE